MAFEDRDVSHCQNYVNPDPKAFVLVNLQLFIKSTIIYLPVFRTKASNIPGNLLNEQFLMLDLPDQSRSSLVNESITHLFSSKQIHLSNKNIKLFFVQIKAVINGGFGKRLNNVVFSFLPLFNPIG